ncbi:YqgE/AlgH family protein [Nereida sp. MMG025]|uniref:YqgE/AlgH family protein n=1 Tax=Nereida sp. MMG025 TaxID=2909981 RepID=UPI001F38538F|nr:YqgE/AlgH family protein [Nereida sp. MMG025]MCF6444378.1 YqgE/AlgH family protein [Nereida sp. MMG025]
MSNMADLTGQLLIAMPGMGDPRFEHSVIYLCAHSDDGAMGLIVNKPSADLTFAGLLKHLNITPSAEVRDIRVHFGGPVDHGRGFVLHSADYQQNDSTLQIAKGIGMTATIDVLEDIALGIGPKQTLMAMGYAGWGAGQLEQEIAMNGWLTAQADPDLVFRTDASKKWVDAIKGLGIDPLMLSADAGRA